MDEIQLLKRRVERERAARQQAERILEQKAKELWDKNIELKELNGKLETLVNERTKELKINQLRFSKLISSLQNGILVEDENGTIVLVNETFCRLFNIHEPPAQLIGKKDVEVHHAIQSKFKTEDRFLPVLRERVHSKKHVLNEQLYLTNNSVLERDYVPIFLKNKYLGHLWMYRDVTERWVASERLRRSEEKYRGIMENMELGLMEVDAHGTILRAYDRFCTMVGYEESELVGQNAKEILVPESSKMLIQKQTDDRIDGKAGIYEIQIQTKSGEIRWALISGAPIYNQVGEIEGSIGIHYDITHQKELQAQLISAKKRAEEAEELEKQFLANMSHEMRTPLNAIVGMSHLLYDTKPSPEQKEYLTVLKSSSDILLHLISDILDLSKIRSGKIEISPRPFDLGGLVRSMHRTFELRLEDSPVNIYYEMDDQIETFLEGDELLLNQILMNIIGNAVKFTKKGRIDLRVQAIEKVRDKYKIQFTIADTGIGIPAEKQELIFQAFRQVDGDIKRTFGGTGLGLAITKRLVEKQNGTIRIASKEGKGSRFTIELCYKDTGQKLEAQEEGINRVKGADLEIGEVLIVEDNAMNRKYICSLFQKWDIPHKIAVNGMEGVRMAKEKAYKIIFMDIQMPVMDGYEATIAIRSSKNPNQHTPIIALTASAMLSNKDKAFEAGMTNYLSKPFTPEQILKILSLYNQNTVKNVGEVTTDKQGTKPDLIEDMYGGDLEYAYDMFQVFIHEMAPKFKALKPLLEKKDFLALGKLAHLLKPSAAMVGQKKLEKALATLEYNAKQGLIEEKIKVNTETVLQCFEIALPEIKTDAVALNNKTVE